MSALLSLTGVTSYYGAIAALKGVDVEVKSGEIVTLIGANGAGKSTLMMTIFGSPQARDGSITYDGRDITRMPTHEIARLKIAQSPEGRRIFPRMSVLENLKMGAAITEFAHFDEDLERMFAIFPRLNDFARMVMCGMIAEYSDTEIRPGPNLMSCVRKRLRIQGFIVSDAGWQRYAQFRSEVLGWMREGRLHWREDVVEGLARAPEAFIGMLRGENFGKLVVAVD